MHFSGSLAKHPNRLKMDTLNNAAERLRHLIPETYRGWLHRLWFGQNPVKVAINGSKRMRPAILHIRSKRLHENQRGLFLSRSYILNVAEISRYVLKPAFLAKLLGHFKVRVDPLVQLSEKLEIDLVIVDHRTVALFNFKNA